MPNERSVGPRVSVPFLCLPHVLEQGQAYSRRAGDSRSGARSADLWPPFSAHGQCGEHVAGHGHRPSGPGGSGAIERSRDGGGRSHGGCAPMNLAYQAEELDRYFADLRPRALIT
jgi:hypothetical protein